MKKGSLIAVLLLVIFTGAANASEKYYEVKKGDTLSGIAKKYGVSLDRLYRINKSLIRDKNKIYPGQKFEIPERISKQVKAAKKNYAVTKEILKLFVNPEEIFVVLTKKDLLNYKNPGRDKYKGDISTEEGIGSVLNSLAYPEAAKKALKEKVLANDFVMTTIKNNDIFVMLYGRNKVRLSVVDLPLKKGKEQLLSAREYSTEIEGVRYTLKIVLACGNPARPPDIKLPPPPPTPPVEEVIPPPPPPPEKPEVPEEPPPVEVPPLPPPVPKIKIEPKKCPIEHEPILGAGLWGNGIAKGSFGYGEYVAWLKTSCDSQYSYGVGIYGSVEDGESKLSAYEWWGYTFGGQLGIKRYWLYRDEQDKKFRAQQWQLKARLVWEETYGKNPDSGYRMNQEHFKLGLYGEYIRQMDDRWQGILIAEGWHSLDGSIKSTWSGDSPSNRTQLSMGAYAQYKLDQNWQIRFGGGPFYQGWDHMWGLHARAEARYKETLMIGPYVNLFPFGKSSIYNGIPTSDLQTIGAFVRIEFGKIIREADRKARMEQIKKLDDEMFGVSEGYETPAPENPKAMGSESDLRQSELDFQPVSAEEKEKIDRLAWPADTTNAVYQ